MRDQFHQCVNGRTFDRALLDVRGAGGMSPFMPLPEDRVNRGIAVQDVALTAEGVGGAGIGHMVVRWRP